MITQLYGLILILAFSFTASLAHSEIYRWTDAQGNVHFGDKKPAVRPAEDISAQLRQQNLDHSANQIRKTLEQTDQRQQARQTEAQQRLGQTVPFQEQREQFCRQARQRLEILQGRVVFFDTSHQPVAVSEQERRQRAEVLSKQIEKQCG